MAYVVLVIQTPNDSIAQLNQRIQEPTEVEPSLQNCTTLLTAITSGCKAGSVQVTVRDTDPSVSTSGSGSTQYTYSKL